MMASAQEEMVKVALSGDENADMGKAQEEMEKKMSEARGLMEKSFDHHDKKGDGRLDPEEAKVFFNNIMELTAGFVVHMMQLSMKTTMDAMTKQFGDEEGMPEAMKAMMKEEMKKEMKKQLDESKGKIAENLESYKANKEERDAEAFKILDTAGDGTLSKEEFLEGFFPGTEKNQEVMMALGFSI
jgi:hypothetical protein